MDLNKKFSLILSGGSALGIGHLGTIKWLEEENFIPKEIIGTSMGALIGALYAKGKTYDEIYNTFDRINFFRVIKLNMPTGNSLMSTKNIKLILEEEFKDLKIKDLKIDLKIITTNVETGNKKVFDKNSEIPLIDAICASISIPGVFEPKNIDNSYYWDGFLSSNLPFEEATTNNMLAIDVINEKLVEKTSIKTLPNSLQKSFFISILNQTREKLQHIKKKNLQYISLNLSKFKIYEFTKWKEIAQIGYEETKIQIKIKT